jgi:8-oxo-dGTP diphosphatase
MEAFGLGVVVILFDREDNILIGERKGSHGAGTWSLPGGKIETVGDTQQGVVSMENPYYRISVELHEETGLKILPDRFKSLEWIANDWRDVEKGDQRWVTLFTEADYQGAEINGTPRVMEPDKCREWRFADPRIIQSEYELFLPLANYLHRFPVAAWPRFKRR